MAENTYAVKHTAVTIEAQLNLASGARIAAAGTEAAAYTQTAYTTAVRTTTAPVTDSTGGAAQAAAAAGVGIQTLCIPHTFIGGTSAVEPITAYTPGYKFKILSWAFVPSVLLVGASGSRVANMEIGTTDVGTTPSTCTILEANAAVGVVTAGTAVAGANTGTSSDTFSIEIASGGTAFSAGSGTFIVRIQNMDTADALAGILANNITQAGLINSLIDDSQAIGVSA